MNIVGNRKQILTYKSLARLDFVWPTWSVPLTTFVDEYLMNNCLGNGKTISIKAILKTCHAEGHSPLYVKSFQGSPHIFSVGDITEWNCLGWKGEEAAMADVFGKARQMAPCVLILEDLDSLINDRNRSFFLNQLDGLEGNDGLLVIGSTNHFERLDPGLSTRPSRFDRK